MKEWFLGLNQRERLIVGVGGAVFVVMMAYLMIWEPIMDGARQTQEKVVSQEKLLAWMQQSAAEVKRLRGGATSSGGQLIPGQSLLSLIDSTAKSAGLGNQVKRVKPEGSNKVRIWLDAVAFDKMVTWLEKLIQTYGVQVNSTVIDKANANGTVNANIELQSI